MKRNSREDLQMNKIKASYLINDLKSHNPIDNLKHIEGIARVCYKSEENITEDGSSAIKMCNNLLLRGHEAMIEHASYIIRMSDEIFTATMKEINFLTSLGYNFFLRYTSVPNPEFNLFDRHVISGNARAWRDFFKAFLIVNGCLPVFSSLLILSDDIDKQVLFGEFSDQIALTDADRGFGAKLIHKDELVTEEEKLVHYDISVKFPMNLFVTDHRALLRKVHAIVIMAVTSLEMK